MSPIMQQFREIETCIECSSLNHIQVRLSPLSCTTFDCTIYGIAKILWNWYIPSAYNVNVFIEAGLHLYTIKLVCTCKLILSYNCFSHRFIYFFSNINCSSDHSLLINVNFTFLIFSLRTVHLGVNLFLSNLLLFIKDCNNELQLWFSFCRFLRFSTIPKKQCFIPQHHYLIRKHKHWNLDALGLWKGYLLYVTRTKMARLVMQS